MPRLLMVATVPDTLRGFLLPFAEHFSSRGFQVDAMADGITRCAACTTGFDRVWDVGWSRHPLDWRNVGACRRVRQVVAQQGYDLVHVHTPVAAFVTRLALRRLRRSGRPRVIYTAHGFHFYRAGPKPQCAVFRALETLAARWTDYLVVINREDEHSARRLLPWERVQYMPGIGVDLDRYGPAAVTDAEVARVRRDLGVGPETHVFLVIAEFIPRKRHRDALVAFARLDRPDARLVLAGAGPLLDEVRQQAAQLGIADRVSFLGVRSDIPALVRASVAVVLASEQEGLPRSVMEALSLGVPVIGTRIRGTADLLQGECGLLVPVGDTEALAGAMRTMLDHPDAARDMARRGRARMAEYDVRIILALHESLYERALATPAGGTGITGAARVPA
jgi:glycosyltransferase involved in cell wall biosynthesis